MEGCFFQGYSGIYHDVPGYLELFATTVMAFGEVRMGVFQSGDPTTTSIKSVSIINSTITGTDPYFYTPGRKSGIYVTNDNTEDIYFEQVNVSCGSTIHVSDANTADINVFNTSLDAYALLRLTESAEVDNVKISQGELINDGFDLTNVYVLGNTTTTCTANNTDTARDYFNNTIV